MTKKYLAFATFFASSLIAPATTLILSDDFESFPTVTGSVVRGISLDPNGGGTNANNSYTAAEALAVNSASGWKDVSTLGNPSALSAESFNGNARWDQTGNGGGTGMRIRANSGAATLDTAMQLSTIGSPIVIMEFDILLDIDAQYSLVIQYSADAAFTNPITLATYDSTDTFGDGNWLEDETVTITDGVGGVVFTDDAYFMIRRDPNDGVGNANNTFHVFDNITITAVPEPSSTLLLGLGSLALIGRRKRV